MIMFEGQKLFGVVGAKGSGKSSCGNFLYSYFLNKAGITSWLNEDGGVVLAQGEEDGAILVDFNLKFGEHEIAHALIYPHFIAYNFARPLKDICELLYGLERAKLYGSNTDKDSLTNYTIADLYGKCPGGRALKEKISHREFMEQLALKLNKVSPEAFIRPFHSFVDNCPSDMIGVFDVRRQSEVDVIHARGGRVIQLTRNPHKSTSSIEESATKVVLGHNDKVIQNDDLSLRATHEEFARTLIDWGYIDNDCLTI
jgi:hypothetical protein